MWYVGRHQDMEAKSILSSTLRPANMVRARGVWCDGESETAILILINFFILPEKDSDGEPHSFGDIGF